jgi:hypothetical protein
MQEEPESEGCEGIFFGEEPESEGIREIFFGKKRHGGRQLNSGGRLLNSILLNTIFSFGPMFFSSGPTISRVLSSVHFVLFSSVNFSTIRSARSTVSKNTNHHKTCNL